MDIDLTCLEEKVFLATFHDGLLEIFFGIMLCKDTGGST